MNSPEGNTFPIVELRGCSFPAHFFYDVGHHIWYEPLANGEIRIGMTCVGSALASYRIFAVTPRRVGREFDAGTSIATIESSKWVGPARVAFGGVIATINEELTQNPGWLAVDPYGKGWIVTVHAHSGDALSHLVSGEAIANAYLAWMNDTDFPGCNAESS